jgi:hypothetical protein
MIILIFTEKEKKMESKDEQPNNEYCFTIHLENMRDSQITVVNLFEYNHTEDTQVEYNSFYPGYDFILRQLAAFKEYDNLKLTKIHINAIHENEEIVLKQFSSELTLKHTAINGTCYSRRFTLEIYYDPEQHQKTIIVPFDYPISLTNQLSIELEYLLPNIELIFTIFYQKQITNQ